VALHLDSLAQTASLECCVLASEGTIEEVVPLLTLGVARSEATTWLERDIALLARHFLGVTRSLPHGVQGRPSIRCRVRLEVLTRNACSRFHHDLNTLRMLCTYSGPGTFWVAREHVNVDALYALGGDIELANRRIVPDPGRVQQAAAWDILLLKGARFSEPDGIGAVHRSPPAATLGIPRLLLTIDAD